MTSATHHPQGVPIGEQLGFLEFLASDEILSSFRDLVGYDGQGFPNIVTREQTIVLLQKEQFGTLESVTHVDRYMRPPVAGRRVQVTGWIREKRRERGSERLLVETFAVDEIGTEILRSEHVFRQGTGRSPERLGRRPVRLRTDPGTQLLLPVNKRVTEETIEKFEEVHRALAGQNALSRGTTPGTAHTSAGLATGMGLSATVAPEELSLAYLYELLDRRFGINFRQGGHVVINYRRPIYAGDSLSAQGMVTGKEQAGERTVWKLMLWVENGRGEPVATGDARVTVPSPLT